MESTKVKRYVKSFSHVVDAAPEKVFPLLCPTREYNWIQGWACDMVYSESGFAEKDCIFTKDLPLVGHSIWVVSRFELNERIEFVITCPQSHVEKLEIALEKQNDDKTKLTWTRIYTSLTPAGAEHLGVFVEKPLDHIMTWLAQSLNHYCVHGEMLKAGSLPDIAGLRG